MSNTAELQTEQREGFETYGKRGEMLPADSKNVDWVVDTASGICMSKGATDAAWRTIQKIGSYLGFPEGNNLYNQYLPTENMVPVGLMLIVLGSLLYDSYYYSGENTKRIVGPILDYLRK